VITLEKVMFLRQVPLFERIPSAELVRIAEVTEELVVTAGQRVFDEGDFGEELYVIADGSIRITLGEKTLATLGRTDYFGEMSLLDGEPRSAGARAETDALLLRISQGDFYQTLRRHFDASLAVIRTLSHRLRVEIEKNRERQEDSE
jgi:CRP-like cAMP-binding protein